MKELKYLLLTLAALIIGIPILAVLLVKWYEILIRLMW
jgi:hypothetical protein